MSLARVNVNSRNILRFFMHRLGLAESCLFVTGVIGAEIRISDGVVSCGKMTRNESANKYVKTVNKEGQIIVEDGCVGEIYIRGPDLASGYWGNPELTQESFHNTLEDGHDYFRTGDLGKIVDGYLFVAGRTKELIIINGRNVYPTDLERTLEDSFPDLIRPGSTVAFQFTDVDVRIVMEVRKTADSSQVSREVNASSVRLLMSSAFGVQVGLIHVLKQGTVPKTISGKLRRVECRRIALENVWDRKTLVWESGTSMSDESISVTTKDPLKSSDMNHVDGVEEKCDAVFKGVLGADFDVHKSWEENGLTSLMHAELIDAFSQALLVTVPVSFETTYPTPGALKPFVLGRLGTPFPTKLPNLDELQQSISGYDQVPSNLSALLQAIGVALNFFVLALSIVPSYLIGRELAHLHSILRFGVILPVFILSLSAIVFVLKWAVIGRYRSAKVSIPSLTYLRWWFVDRIVHLWEFWVGQYIVKTPVIWLFYWLMGAKIHPLTKIDAFIREFDLVTIGKGVSLSHQVRCRKFGPWRGVGGPTIRFRHITIGKYSVVDGMVSPGSSVGERSQIAKQSVLPEGSQVPSRSLAKGNPAFDAGSIDLEEDFAACNLMFHTLKVVWLLAEMCIFSAFALVGEHVWTRTRVALPRSWRYTPLLYWVLLLLTASILSIFASVALKWILIGRRRPPQSKRDSSVWREFCYWACDYHFDVTSRLFGVVSDLSRIWNVILMAHGLDIDMKSAFVNVQHNFPPSKVDFLQIRNSFVSAGVSFEIGEGKTKIIDSSIGYSVQVAPGVEVRRSAVQPFGEVNESLCDHNLKNQIQVSSSVAALKELFMLLTVGISISSLIPSFEFFLYAALHSSLGVAAVGLAGTVVIQCVVWTILLRLLQSLVLLNNRDALYFQPMYAVFLIFYSWVLSTYSHWFALWGTPFFTLLMRFMGAEVKGELLYYGRELHDFPHLIFDDKTIIDECQLTGHYQVGHDLTIGPSHHAGLLHEECFTVANTFMQGNVERGPWKAILGNASVVTMGTTNMEETAATTKSEPGV
jgi:hypothetical protein